jgi:hypothetical protein
MARDWYRRFCRLHGTLRVQLRANRATQAVCQQIDAMQQVAGSCDVNPVAADRSGPSAMAVPAGLWQGTVGNICSGWLTAYLIATAIFAVGLAIGAIVHVSQPGAYVGPPAPTPNPQFPIPNPSSIVGRITGMVDCVLSNDECRMLNAELRTQETDIHHSSFITQHSPIHLGDCLALKSGLLEITYDTGAKVILQGPVNYEVESPAGGYLSLGKLTAKLEKESEVGGQRSESANQKSEIISHKSFFVRTPTALVTDLGTEFGVAVDESGATQSHVFRGSVRVERLSAGGTDEASSQVLHANESTRVTDNRRDKMVVVRNVESTNFIREIPGPSVKTLDLVDVVAGGNGFSANRNRGIDPRSGRVMDTLVTAPNPMVSDNKYHRVDAVPLVDGVFIPNGGATPVQLDSAGHRFDGFAATDNKTSDYLWAGGPFGGNSTELGGVNYASSGHGLLAMHANKGITFDLDAIRRANPGWKLLRFLATAGNTETASERGTPVFADVWVFADGQLRFKRWQITRYNGALPVSVPIADSERFLTLVATDGGNGISFDHIMFGDPRIEMKATPSAASSISLPETIRH